jgi:hypothetical protein
MMMMMMMMMMMTVMALPPSRAAVPVLKRRTFSDSARHSDHTGSKTRKCGMRLFTVRN